MNEERRIILSLGSNIGDRKSFIEQAIFELEKSFQTSIKQSNLYETEPWGFQTENSFLNCCIHFKSSQDPEEILKITQNIEQKLGRLRKTNKNIYHSRTIDIDLIFVGDLEINTKNLKIPHPRLYQRNFVLIPLLELSPDFIDPFTKQTIKELIKRCNDENEVLLYKE